MSEVVPMLDAAGKDLFLVRVVHTSIHFVNICLASGQVLGVPCQRQVLSFASLSPHLCGTKYGQVVSTPASYLIIPRYVSRPRPVIKTEVSHFSYSLQVHAKVNSL